MVYANKNYSREFSNRKMLIVCASVFEIIFPGPGRDQNNLPHTVKIMVIHIMFGRLFDNSIKKMVNWSLDHSVRELGKLKVSSYLQTDLKYTKSRNRNFGYLPTTV